MQNVFIRFERGRDSVMGPVLGPFPFVQVTYESLRVGPNGDEIAVHGEDGDWYLKDSWASFPIKEIGDFEVGENFSDFIVYAG